MISEIANNINAKNFITRFAPSPTGYLHLGHVLSMAYVFGIAETTGAKVLLRMEDHDTERCRKEYEVAILDDMAWLGFIPDNWTEFTQKDTTCFRQSDQFDVYERELNKLQKLNRVYACACSRRQLAEEVDGHEHVYPGTCRSNGNKIIDQSGFRFIVDDREEIFVDVNRCIVHQRPADQCGDFLVKDRRGCYTYNFAVVVDDIDQGVNLVIRGDDLLHCTGRQVALGRALGAVSNPLYYHHPLANGVDGKKLSKRAFSDGIILRRQRGDNPQDTIGEALWMAGVLPEKMPVKAEDISRVLGGEKFSGAWK